jgi:carbon-monoxide dehydrogenase medium subunit
VYIPDFELHRPSTLDQAGALLQQHGLDARLLAGGTDLLVDLKTGRVVADQVVSLHGIDGLRGITRDGGALRIGALTTINQLNASPLLDSAFSALRDATTQMAAHQIRNAATVGGNIASAVPCADLPPLLIAMKADALLWSAGIERSVPLEAFFLGPRQTVMQEGEVLIAVLVSGPPAAGFGAAYARLALRNGNGIAVAAVAAGLTVQDGVIGEARVVLGAVAPIPLFAEEAGELLAGRKADAAAFAEAAAAAQKAAEPISDIRGSKEYRRDVVGVLATRALQGALKRATDGPTAGEVSR